jgi:hypothetical protein
VRDGSIRHGAAIFCARCAGEEIERLTDERDEAQEAARWWRQAASGYVLSKDETHPDSRWPWLQQEV